jgi:hypothetical protein
MQQSLLVPGVSKSLTAHLVMGQEPRIYLKDADLKSIPSILTHHLTPILFAESGKMPSSKGKPKKCVLAVNLSGIFLLRPQAGTIFKLSLFVSTYEIETITWNDAKRRTVTVIDRPTTYFSCKHADEAVVWILAARRALFLGLHDPRPPTTEGFTDDLRIPAPSFLVSQENLAQLRYVCLSRRFESQPSEGTIELLGSIDPSKNPTLLIDETTGSLDNLKCFTMPILQFTGLTTVHIQATAPYSVCRLVHYLVKGSSSIRTIIIADYEFLIPAQLRFAKQKHNQTAPLSLLFLNCALPPEIFADLMTELATFAGDYQRLTFTGMEMNAMTCESLFSALETGRPFRTLEVLELEHCTLRQPANSVADLILKGIARIVRQLRFLYKFSLSRWSFPFWVPLGLFSKMNCLTEIKLQRIEMHQTFENLSVPGWTYLLDFSSSSFSPASFLSMLEMVSRCRTPLSLVLQDITMAEEAWQTVFGQFEGINPPTCLQELNWSGNLLPASAIAKWVRCFFSTGRIRFLAIDRLFRTSSLADLKTLLQSIPPNTLWGLSVGGGFYSNFAGHFQTFLQVLDIVKGIAILRLDGQKLSDSDVTLILNFLQRHDHIREFSCDDTGITTEAVLFEFYRNLCQMRIDSVAPPLSDIERFFIKDGKMLPVTRDFDTFRAALQQKNLPTTAHMRAYYMAVLKKGQPEISEVHWLSNRFPECFSDARIHDPFGFTFNKERQKFSAIGVIHVKGTVNSLSDLHNRKVSSPHGLPSYESEQPAAAPGPRRKEDNARGLGIAPTIAEEEPEEPAGIDVRIEPLADVEEFRQVLIDLGESDDEDGDFASSASPRSTTTRAMGGKAKLKPGDSVERKQSMKAPASVRPRGGRRGRGASSMMMSARLPEPATVRPGQPVILAGPTEDDTKTAGGAGLRRRGDDEGRTMARRAVAQASISDGEARSAADVQSTLPGGPLPLSDGDPSQAAGSRSRRSGAPLSSGGDKCPLSATMPPLSNGDSRGPGQVQPRRSGIMPRPGDDDDIAERRPAWPAVDDERPPVDVQFGSPSGLPDDDDAPPVSLQITGPPFITPQSLDGEDRPALARPTLPVGRPPPIPNRPPDVDGRRVDVHIGGPQQQDSLESPPSLGRGEQPAGGRGRRAPGHSRGTPKQSGEDSRDSGQAISAQTGEFQSQHSRRTSRGQPRSSGDGQEVRLTPVIHVGPAEDDGPPVSLQFVSPVQLPASTSDRGLGPEDSSQEISPVTLQGPPQSATSRPMAGAFGEQARIPVAIQTPALGAPNPSPAPDGRGPSALKAPLLRPLVPGTANLQLPPQGAFSVQPRAEPFEEPPQDARPPVAVQLLDQRPSSVQARVRAFEAPPPANAGGQAPGPRQPSPGRSNIRDRAKAFQEPQPQDSRPALGRPAAGTGGGSVLDKAKALNEAPRDLKPSANALGPPQSASASPSILARAAAITPVTDGRSPPGGGQAPPPPGPGAASIPSRAKAVEAGTRPPSDLPPPRPAPGGPSHIKAMMAALGAQQSASHGEEQNEEEEEEEEPERAEAHSVQPPPHPLPGEPPPPPLPPPPVGQPPPAGKPGARTAADTPRPPAKLSVGQQQPVRLSIGGAGRGGTAGAGPVQILFRPSEGGTANQIPSFSIRPEPIFQPPTVPILEGISPVGPPGLDIAESYSVFAAIELPPDQTRAAQARRANSEVRGKPAGQPPARQARQSQPPPKVEPAKPSKPAEPAKPSKPAEPPYRPPAQDIVRGIEPVPRVDVAALVRHTYYQDVALDPSPEQPVISLLPRPQRRT